MSEFCVSSPMWYVTYCLGLHVLTPVSWISGFQGGWDEIPSEDLESKWHKHNIASCQTNLGLPLTKHETKDSWNHILLIVSGRHAPLHVGMHAKRFACLLVCLFDCKRWPQPYVQAFPPSADNKGSQTLEQIDYNIIPLMPLPIT